MIQIDLLRPKIVFGWWQNRYGEELICLQRGRGGYAIFYEDPLTGQDYAARTHISVYGMKKLREKQNADKQDENEMDGTARPTSKSKS